MGYLLGDGVICAGAWEKAIEYTAEVVNKAMGTNYNRGDNWRVRGISYSV